MEKKPSQLRQNEQQELAAHQQSIHQSEHQFATVEELLRYDAAQTPVPPGVAERLKNSLEQEPKPTRSWWRRWFGSSIT